LLTATRKLELRGHSAYHKHVILRSPPFFWADHEGSPQFAGNIHPSGHGLAVQTNCRDSSSANKNGGLLPRASLGKSVAFHGSMTLVSRRGPDANHSRAGSGAVCCSGFQGGPRRGPMSLAVGETHGNDAPRRFTNPGGVCVTTSDFAFSATQNQSLTLWKKAKNRVFTQTPEGLNWVWRLVGIEGIRLLRGR
jgi:hypothetical protein